MLFSLISLKLTHEYYFLKYITIFFISFISNTFSAISGGGAGLLQLPALILIGVPYYQALATHKLATVALGIGGSIRNYKSLKDNYSILFKIIIFGTPGVVFGTTLVDYFSEQYLYFILGLLSIFLAFYSSRRSNLGLFSLDKKLNIHEKIKFFILIFLIGILNGSVSSGTGLFMTILLIKTLKIDFLRAVSLTFFSVGIIWNATGALFLSRFGTLETNFLIILICGSLLGGFFGAHLSNLKGNELIKNTFTVVCLFVGLSLLVKSINILFELV